MKTTNLIYVGLFLLTAACSSPQTNSPTTAGNQSTNTPSNPLVANPPIISVATNGTTQLGAMGGVPPYKYQVTAGGGTVGFTTGTYNAPASNGVATVTLSDSAGTTRTIQITIGTGTSTPSPTPNPNPTTSNCSQMLSYPYAALQDNSSTGLGNATASNQATAQLCSTWCGSLNSGYCMWSPNPGGSPVCVAWPKGTTMSAYQSSWQTYSGSCQ